jgi:chaperonin GroEL
LRSPHQARRDGAVVIGKLLEAKDYAFGFGAQIGEYADLVRKGIIDPTLCAPTFTPNYCNALARKAPSLLELFR